MPATVTDIGADTEIRVSDLTTIEDFLRTGKSEHAYKKGALLRDKAGDSFLYRDGEFIMLRAEYIEGDNGDAAVAVVGKSFSDAGGLRNEVSPLSPHCVFQRHSDWDGWAALCTRRIIGTQRK